MVSASPAANPGARLSVPEGLVGDEGHADGRNDAEGRQGRHLPCDRKQPEQQHRRDRSPPPEATADA